MLIPLELADVFELELVDVLGVVLELELVDVLGVVLELELVDVLGVVLELELVDVLGVVLEEVVVSAFTATFTVPRSNVAFVLLFARSISLTSNGILY